MDRIIEELKKFGIRMESDHTIFLDSPYMTEDNVWEYIKVKYPNKYKTTVQ